MTTKFFIIVTGYNCQSYVGECYKSILNQTYKNFDCIFITDGCTDNTVNELINLKNTDSRFEFFTCSENMGAAYRRWQGINEFTKKKLNADTVICLVGMDDYLKPNALEVVSKHYDSGKWMTYGNWQTPKGDGLVNGFLTYKDNFHLNRSYRKDIFRATALNTFKKFLFDRLFEDDFKFNGEWIKATTESNLMFSCLEMCGKERIGVVEDIIYIYNKGRTDNARNRFGSNYQDAIFKDVLSKPKKRPFNKKEIVTVGLPVFYSPIVWLALESLCRQKTTCDWELIIYEDEKQPMGEAYFTAYNERLSAANCIRVSYMYSKKRIPLTYKWIDIAKHSDTFSLGVLLQAADCYSEPNRIQTAFDKLSQGFDWIHSKYGIFYNCQSKKSALFDGVNSRTGLNMTICKSELIKMQKTDIWSGVDNWLLRNLKHQKPNAKIFTDNSDNWKNGLDTDGHNTISKGRCDFINQLKPPFYPPPMFAHQCIPNDVFAMLNEYKRPPIVIHEKIKVLNISTHDWANFAHDNAKALQAIGVHCVSAKVHTHKFNYSSQSGIMTPQRIMNMISDYDIIQLFHSDTNYLQTSINKKKKIIVYHTGSDYRRDPDKYNAIFNPHVFMTFTDQCEFMELGAKNVKYIATAVDIPKQIPNFKTNLGLLKFAHYPSDAEVKGTSKIKEMLSKIKGKFNLSLSAEIVGHKLQQKRMSDCDVYIELFNPELNGKPYGCYGVTAFEAAALGKIVVTQNLNQQVYNDTYGDCPFIICNTENDFIQNIEKLISMDKNEIEMLKQKTFDWVKENHSYQKTGEYILKHIL